MNRISKTRRARAKRLTEGYADCHGIEFDEYRIYLPERVSEWHKVVTVQDRQVAADFHDWWLTCWNCEMPYESVEAHHIIGGTKGRSDEYCNIAMLCRGCHANANTAKLPMGRILYLKWKYDRQHTDWVRVALLRRSFLPSLITDNGVYG